MGNVSIYLSRDEKKKLIRIAETCNVPASRLLRLAVRHLPEAYFIDFVKGYDNE